MRIAKNLQSLMYKNVLMIQFVPCPSTSTDHATNTTYEERHHYPFNNQQYERKHEGRISTISIFPFIFQIITPRTVPSLNKWNLFKVYIIQIMSQSINYSSCIRLKYTPSLPNTTIVPARNTHICISPITGAKAFIKLYK